MHFNPLATGAFAASLYKHFQVLKKYALDIIASVLFGSIVIIISSVYHANWMNLRGSYINTEYV
ncbi:LrgB family protein [Paenibacillus sp. FA6]|uniref:LrgB family protein n=1 Tax=Paenibacillus sp. FA6 TaxID=3413029 RepID=UPI003F65B388